LTASKDASVNEYAWGTNEVVSFVADDYGANSLFHAKVTGEVGTGIHYKSMRGGVVARHGYISGLTCSRDGKAWTHLFARMDRPADVEGVRFDIKEDISSLSSLGAYRRENAKLLAELDLPRPESVTVPVESGKMQMWILKPPGFDPNKKWPLAYLVHGGPQGVWGDAWSYRWNPQVWAAQGYVVALPNPRGSTGFGQKFVDEITGDWGGKCYDDLMKGVDYLEKQPYIDTDRMIAAGGSFGGYMVNWFATHTPRFKALVTHCSVYNFESMYATTDEVWFDEWEHGGPPWGTHRESYEKHSPHRYAANLGKFKTPMLVIQNDLDFRCPVGQGHELFTALQRQGVPSRFINFPDEGHWVLKPANSKRWHEEVFAWITKYAPPGGR
jgi:dipeptidyl aminopeptidase/acylaminoacyl peptidase